MATSLFNRFDSLFADAFNGAFNLSTDNLKIALSNTQPVVANHVFADIVEIAAGNGYNAGGNLCPITSSSQTNGLYKLIPAGDVVFTPVGGTIGPFQFAVLYDSTALNGNLIGWWDYGLPLSVDPGIGPFTVHLDTGLGIFEVQ